MNIKKFSLMAALAGVLLASCKKEDPLGNVDDIPGLGGDTWQAGPIDDWLFTNLVAPFNISTKYKWDQFEIELDKTVVPVKEEKVIPVMSAIKAAWIDAYIAEAGLEFFKKYSPKHFVLEGSGSYNTDGTATIGTAEGGRKIILYQLNYFRTKEMTGYTPADSTVIKQLFHVIHHEFGHILHQNIMYPLDYKAISVALYAPTWFNYSDEEAHNEGFISNYAISNPDDDFVEMISLMLVYGKTWFDQMVEGINYAGATENGTTAEQAKSNLRQKEALVVSYFKTAWNIDFYSLQARTRAAIEGFLY